MLQIALILALFQVVFFLIGFKSLKYHGAFHGLGQDLQTDRFDQVLVGIQTHGGGGCLDARLAGNENDGCVRIFDLAGFQQRQAIFAIQTNIGNNNIMCVGTQKILSHLVSVGYTDQIAILGECLFVHLADQRIVLNDKNPRPGTHRFWSCLCHVCLSFSPDIRRDNPSMSTTVQNV